MFEYGKNMDSLKINVGPLDSSTSVYSNVVKDLNKFNDMWRQGIHPKIIWDLRFINSGKVNIAAISFFLALAHRVYSFTGLKQEIYIDWDQRLFGFLTDIGFFEIADEYDLFEWPYEPGEGDSGKLNPNTQLLSFDCDNDLPNLENPEEVSFWKKNKRERHRRSILDKCERLFYVKDINQAELPLVISRTCSELVINSLLWGGASSFVGLQRTSNYIFINVSDIGKGFRHSLNSKYSVNLNDDIHAIALGSVINKNDFGLKRAIDTVIDLGGSVNILSNGGEVLWCDDLWYSFKNNFNPREINNIGHILPEPIKKSSSIDKASGYIRSWSNSIRGTRIEFVIPVVNGV